MDYVHLRAEYDAAFHGLRRADTELRSILKQHSADEAAKEMARQRFDRATNAYRSCRKNLAEFLLARQPAESRGVPMGSLGDRHDVQSLAHRLWEEAGRPQGKAEEHWYRAEERVRSGQFQVAQASS